MHMVKEAFHGEWLLLGDAQDTEHIKSSEKPYSVFLKLI